MKDTQESDLVHEETFRMKAGAQDLDERMN